MTRAGMFRVSADAYDRFVGRYSPALAAALIEFTLGRRDRAKPGPASPSRSPASPSPRQGSEPGMRALDVGCGPGALTTALAERLGAENVRAVDPSEPFVEACRARAPGVEVAVASAEALPFADDEFDAALSQLVVNFMRDAGAGVRELARVTRPGGIVASCVWDYRGEMTLLRTFWDAAREVAPDAGAADEGAVMRWCTEDELSTLWRSAGLEEVRSAPLVVRAAYAGFEDLWSPLPEGVGPAGAFCVGLEEPRRAALHDAFRRRLGVGDEPFELSARALAVAGLVR